MKRELVLRNRQRIRAIDLRLLRRIGQELLDEMLPGGQFELGVHLVSAPEMEKLMGVEVSDAQSSSLLTNILWGLAGVAVGAVAVSIAR